MTVAGDAILEEVTVDPYDGTTAASLRLVDPDDVVTMLGATSSDAGHTWRVRAVYSAPGEWLRSWVVTGTGAGSTPRDSVRVAPDVGDLGVAGPVYATTGDLARYIGAAPPEGGRRMLARASEHVDRLLLCARYDTDTDGRPTDDAVADVLRRATCAQVKWWVDSGDDTGVIAGYNSVSIASVSLSSGGGGGTTAATTARQTAPDCWSILATGGLTGHGPTVEF